MAKSSAIAADRANHPRVYRWMSIAFSRRSAATISESKYGNGRSTRSTPSSTDTCRTSICVPASRTLCCERVCTIAV